MKKLSSKLNRYSEFSKPFHEINIHKILDGIDENST